MYFIGSAMKKLCFKIIIVEFLKTKWDQNEFVCIQGVPEECARLQEMVP